jgi:preprotein translocase SecE subunit
MFFKYKPGEGGIARATAFWSLAGFAYLAARRFYLWSQRFELSEKDLLGVEIPVLAFPLTPGFLAALVLFFAGAWGIVRLLNAPKVADLLIDTELEMKKVTWPSFDEARKASFVVIACVLVMFLFLTLTDFGLEKLFFQLIYGGSADGR